MSHLEQIAAELPKLSKTELTELQGVIKSELRRKTGVPWPDFAARQAKLFPDGPPPGKPLSEIVSEGRGEY